MVWICAVRGQLLLALNAPECGLPRNLGERLSAFVGGSGGNGGTSLRVSPARRLLMLLARWTAARNVTCPSVQHFLLSRSPVRQQRLIFVWDREEATLILVTRSSFAGGSLQMCDSSALEACSPRIVSLFQPRTGARSHIEACCCPEHRGSVSYRTRCPFSSPLCCLTGCSAALRQRKGTRRRSLCCDAERSRRPRRAAHNPPPSCSCAFASAGKLP